MQTENCGFIINGAIVKDEENANYYPARRYKNAFPGGHYANGGPDGALYGKQDRIYGWRTLFQVAEKIVHSSCKTFS